MRKNRVTCLFAGLTLMAGMAVAQTAASDPGAAGQAPAAPAATPSPSPFTHWGTDFSFLLDGYADANINHPDSGYNQLRDFDFRADTAHINMGKVTIDHAPAPVGFHLDVGFGQTFDYIHSTDRAPEAFKYFEQAYVSVKPKQLHGLEVDLGEFVTSAGAEVIETNGNWNYTRSLLFAWAIPFYHFGIRTSFPVGQHFTGGVQVVQGWNNIYDNNSGKTIGLTGAYAWKRVTWSNVYYVGPEKTGTTKGLRNLYDTTVLVNASDKLSYYINFDYGQDKNIASGSAKWGGIAGAMRYAVAKKFAVASRVEYFKDADGFATGAAQALKEVTLTGEYKPVDWLITRAEFRNDWSDIPFFQKRSGLTSTQPTFILGMVAFFGPKK